ncbi:hypothetical protein F7725_016467, partial [Dissostichus mawsoni]
MKDLAEEPNSQSFGNLAQVTLTQIVLFNRKRQGEVSKMELQTFTSRNRTELNPDIMMGLTEFEKTLTKYFDRVEIRGKRSRMVPVLLTPEMIAAMNLLVEKRNECQIHTDNVYLFARPGGLSHYRGSDCFRKYANQSGAKNPEALTSTRLRKQVATLSTVLNLKENEMDQLATFLGHDIRVHREFYRLPESTLQLAKVSKLLIAMEKGRLSDLQGKGLDDIEINPEAGKMRSKWTGDEVQAVERHLFSFITSCRVPDRSSSTWCVKEATQQLVRNYSRKNPHNCSRVPVPLLMGPKTQEIQTWMTLTFWMRNVGTDEDSDSGGECSEYVPSQSSSDSEGCSNGEGPSQPPVHIVAKNLVKKIGTSHPQNDNDEQKGEEDVEKGSKITVKSCTKGDKRKWDKKHYCIFCKLPQSKIARHLERKHHSEELVAKATCLPKSSKKRRLMLDQLRYKGDYNHNIAVLQSGQGELVTSRQPSEEADPHGYLPCNYCYGFFVKSELWKHEVNCKKNVAYLRKNHGKGTESKLQLRVSFLSKEMQQRDVRKYFPECCMMTCLLRLLEKHGSDASKDGYVSQKMREMGRFVIAAKTLNTSVKTLQDILVPPMFKLAVDAAKKASGYTKAKYRYDRPSLALKLGHTLKTVGDILIGQYVKEEDEAAANRVRSFLGLVSSEWNHYVSHRARTNLEEKKWNRKEMIPLTEDVLKLQKYLKSVEEDASEKLAKGPDPKAYRMLSETILSQIILFNRRRQGEAAKMLLDTYHSKNTEDLNEDVMQCLSKLERDLSKEFTRVVIRGKRGRKVPVLLTKRMTNSLDFLLENRTQENEILETNIYVFATANSDSNIRGSDCLRKFAQLCDAKHPETLTSTQLRKQIATLIQIMNLQDHEMDQVAKFMGHDIRVHREYYRLTENTMQLAKMSKLLMAIEMDTNVYKGKSLDDLDLDLGSSAVQKGNQRRPWSEAEKKAVWSQLGNWITLMKVPGKKKCTEC